VGARRHIGLVGAWALVDTSAQVGASALVGAWALVGTLAPGGAMDGSLNWSIDAMRRRASRGRGRVPLMADEIASALARLPDAKTPTKTDWARLSWGWQGRLDGRIRELERLRDDLGGCIGCGRLSLRTRRLLNADDKAGADGPGARHLIYEA
jgi:redox-sensitive transcriptional activator SoxR